MTAEMGASKSIEPATEKNKKSLVDKRGKELLKTRAGNKRALAVDRLWMTKKIGSTAASSTGSTAARE